ncbi:tRNA pseudouridine(38-40) synthase TruA [Agarilytica rhodophyticola]|uniref:tRNA pseudouridine(38-40) synthase TruA n=1 Tax=Agarilytica rhodophyticola TaxID=1737490 RepID=UPI000B341C9E|nr:tRNA pseudouridine(38-40) synthase TruA [Agarilytica rhodophyticola]
MYSRNCEIKPGIEFPDNMQRVALGVEYNGAPFNGFQKQASTANTIQAALEAALSKVANEPISLVCAGRTDAGVHASEQVVHFDTLAQRPAKAWVQGVNTQLPFDIRVHWSKPVSPDFHARFSATARTYRYVIYAAATAPACFYQSTTWTSYQLDIERMQEAGQYLLGEHDFSSFRAAYCQARVPVRHIYNLRFYRSGAFIIMEVKANAFLHHMVRNIVGTMMDIGRGAREPAWVEELLQLKDRKRASPTAKPWGLYLVKVDYDAQFALPQTPAGPIFVGPAP